MRISYRAPLRCGAGARRLAMLTAVVGAGIFAARPVRAQTDYYNTDHGRPIETEDAYPVERRAFELQLAPLRLERAKGGVYRWGIQPQVAFGILPRTHVEIGAPLALVDRGQLGHTSGLAGVDLSVLHNLNVETAIPAFGIRGDVLLAAGGLGPDESYASLKGIATKTYRWARLHLNGQYTFGDEPRAGGLGLTEVSRWFGGLAVDRAFPLKSSLVTAEVVARQPIHASEDVEWSVGTGVRYQLSPRLALDGGFGRQLTGDERAWHVTFGSAFAFGLPWYPR